MAVSKYLGFQPTMACNCDEESVSDAYKKTGDLKKCVYCSKQGEQAAAPDGKPQRESPTSLLRESRDDEGSYEQALEW